MVITKKNLHRINSKAHQTQITEEIELQGYRLRPVRSGRPDSNEN